MAAARIEFNVFKTRDLALIIILSALGGGVSVLVGYAGNLIKSLPFLPMGTSQILSGVHVLWILLAGLLIRRTGAATLTGAVKGLVELTLFSVHGIQVLPVSIVEGLVAELVLGVLGRDSRLRVSVAGGLSASSNVVVMWVLLLQSLPLPVIAFMWVLSLVSGLAVGYFADYVSRRAALIYR
jgi:energy-coupling factor transport system substrate-specific component